MHYKYIRIYIKIYFDDKYIINKFKIMCSEHKLSYLSIYFAQIIKKLINMKYMNV